MPLPKATAALTLVVAAAAGVVTIATHHHHRPVDESSSATLAPVLPLPVLRSHERPRLSRHVETSRARQRPHLTVVASAPTLDITAYCATGNQTASGKWPQVGMAASNHYPFGTRLHIDGYGDVTVEDRIGWGSDVDIYFGDGADCEQRASDFGRQHRRVSVVSR